METKQRDIPTSPNCLPRPPSGSVCNKGESPTRLVCVSFCRSECSGNRRTFHRLEVMGKYLFVSSDESDFEGFNEADFFQGRSCASRPLLAEQSMVPSTDATQAEGDQIQSSSNITNSRHRDLIRSLVSDPQPSYLDFLTLIYMEDRSLQIIYLY